MRNLAVGATRGTCQCPKAGLEAAFDKWPGRDANGPTSSPETAPAMPGRGAIAQLGERLNGIQEVRGSTPLGSTIDISLRYLIY